MATLDQALELSEKLSPSDRLRLISLLSERLHDELVQNDQSVDMLSLAGLGAELWQQIDIATYLDQERSAWEN